ncbi:hypothetical protein RB595_009478 [Gaeumannomyces hyphopodioides]
MALDPFDDVLNLEDQFYQEGYQQGAADGGQAGKIEGRGLGLEKGYEKFLEAGRLYGRSLVWGTRLSQQAKQSEEGRTGTVLERQELPPLPANPRLRKNIVTLHALVEPETLSTENTDEAVNDFDDRVKRAQGKVRIIEKTTGEQVPKRAAPASQEPAGVSSLSTV